MALDLERSASALPVPVRSRLERLAPDQRAAATASPGPVLCVAPAGSGKTTTVVARTAWRIATGSDAGTICALTFNRRAASELQERVDGALMEIGVVAGSVRVRTFHALGREILAEAGVDVTRIVARDEVLAELAGEPLDPAALRWLDEAFTRLKLDPERAPLASDAATHGAFADYQRELSRRDAIDLDDLVARATPALAADPRLLERWQRRCHVLFVDEAQDLDRAQLELVVTLAGDARDVFLVGDDDQTIYAWRLADVRRVLGLASRLPGLRRVDLETNHRCAPAIVHRAARLVAHNRERFSKRIRASPGARGSLTLAPDSGDAVARARRLLTGWVGADDGSHAILARTNAELAPVAAVALELAIPYRAEDDGLWLDPSVLPSAPTSVGGDAPAGAEGASRAPLLEIDALLAGSMLPEVERASLLAWAPSFGNPAQLQEAIRKRREARERLTDMDPTITLATVHGTKGLEWDHVATIGFDDGTFPSGRALREAADPPRVLEEERRLAYVAWTRARYTLTIVFDPGAPSRFLLEAFDVAELARREDRTVTGSSRGRRRT